MTEVFFRFRQQTFWLLVQFKTRLLKVVSKQQGDVLAPLPQGPEYEGGSRSNDGTDLREIARRFPVRRGDDADIDLAGQARADGVKLTVREHAK